MFLIVFLYFFEFLTTFLNKDDLKKHVVVLMFAALCCTSIVQTFLDQESRIRVSSEQAKKSRIGHVQAKIQQGCLLCSVFDRNSCI